jgi:sulfite reductase beta subunit-like hemoprotein
MQRVITNDGKGRADLTNMPRKINICVSPTRDDFPHTHINDLGFQAVRDSAGAVVFNVEVGGYFSIKRNVTSIPLGVSVSEDQVPFLSTSCKSPRCGPPGIHRTGLWGFRLFPPPLIPSTRISQGC